MTSSPVPSRAQTRRRTTLGSIAGIGVNRPPASAPLARRLSGNELSGVSDRVQAKMGVSTASLAAGAARAALQAARINQEEVEMILVGTTTPDVLWPSTACLVQTELKLPMVGAFDLYAAETSLLAAFNVATHYMAAGARALLVIGAESDNQLVDLPGQAASARARAAVAAVLTPSKEAAGIMASCFGGAARTSLNSDGHDKALLQGLTDAASECLTRADLSLEDVDVVIADQSAPEIMHAWLRRQNVEASRLLLDPVRYGSLLAVAPFIVLHDAVRAGRVKEGMTVLLLGCGTGPVWAAACLRWNGGGIHEW